MNDRFRKGNRRERDRVNASAENPQTFINDVARTVETTAAAVAAAAAATAASQSNCERLKYLGTTSADFVSV